MSAEANLTGVWQGLFTYPRHFSAVNFGATLIEAGSWLSGSTHEPCTIGPHRGEVLYATLLGRRDGPSVSWVKTYDGSAERYHSVHYEGEVTDDYAEISGTWRTSAEWCGRFLMIRCGGHSIEERREAFERA